MTTETQFQPVHVAGRYGYVEVSPTADERERGFVRAYMVLDFSRINPDDGMPEFVYVSPVNSVHAARREARELHRYEVEGGEALNRLAIREWAQEIAESR